MIIALGVAALFLATCIAVAFHWKKTGYREDVLERGGLYAVLTFFGLWLIRPVDNYRDRKDSARRLEVDQRREAVAAEEEKQKTQILESEKELLLLGIHEDYLAKLQPADRLILDRLSECPIFDLLAFKLKQTNLFEGSYDIWEHCVTYKRFMFFKGRPSANEYNPRNIKAMYSPKVDMVWHTHILYTKDYEEFCNQIFGEFIHHTPCNQLDRSESTVEMRRWLHDFRQAFGEVPEDLELGRYIIQCG